MGRWHDEARFVPAEGCLQLRIGLQRPTEIGGLRDDPFRTSFRTQPYDAIELAEQLVDDAYPCFSVWLPVRHEDRCSLELAGSVFKEFVNRCGADLCQPEALLERDLCAQIHRTQSDQAEEREKDGQSS